MRLKCRCQSEKIAACNVGHGKNSGIDILAPANVLDESRNEVIQDSDPLLSCEFEFEYPMLLQ